VPGADKAEGGKHRAVKNGKEKPMRILDDLQDRPVKKVTLFITRDEAQHLRESLAFRLDEEDADPEWHMHLDDEVADYELFLAIYDIEAPDLEPHLRQFFVEDVWDPPPG
jgi:hypothetical protein